MKTKIQIIILFFTINAVGQQLNNLDLESFSGTWEALYDDDKKSFELELWTDDENWLKGTYKVKNLDSNGNVVKVYESNFMEINLNQEMPAQLRGKMNTSGSVSGYINDNTANVEEDPNNRKGKHGNFSLTMQSNDDNSTQIEFKVSETPGLKLEEYPENYNIPTDIVLTKIEEE